MFEELMSRHGLSLDRMHNFLRIAECGSIAEAAGREPSKQSLYSRQIRELEEYFGTKLTKRQGHGLILTPAGDELASVIREQFKALETFDAKSRQMRQTLTIAAGASLLEWLLAPRFPAFSKAIGSQYDWCLENTRTKDGIASLRTGKIDFLITREDVIKEGGSAIGSAPLFTIDYGLFHWTEEANPKPLAILPKGGQLAENMKNAIASNSDLRDKPTICCQSLLQIAALVSARAADGILPNIAAAAFHQELKSGDLAIRPVTGLKTYRRKLCFAWSKRGMETLGISESACKAAAKALAID